MTWLGFGADYATEQGLLVKARIVARAPNAVEMVECASQRNVVAIGDRERRIENEKPAGKVHG